MIKILIVDDETDARDILNILIQKHIPAEKQILTCSSATEALQVIPEYKPTLIMLDIEMPLMNGFDLLNRIGNWNFDVIFTTAYDKYAIKAIRFSALDYLLKPVDVIDLQNAINRHIIKNQVNAEHQKHLVKNLISNLKQKDLSGFKLAISVSEGVFFIDPKDIIRLEGEGNYTRFYFTNRKPLFVSKIIKEYEEILVDFDFIRVHKSYLVNKKYIDHLDKEDVLWLTDGSHISISRRKKEEVLKELMDRK